MFRIKPESIRERPAFPVYASEYMPTTYPEIYFPIVVQVVIAIAVAAGLIGASTLLGKRGKSPLKDTPYESGMAPVGSARERFSVKFYLVGMIFILFDIEAVFLFPWVVVFRELKLFGLAEMFVFVVLVLVGFFYVYKKGVLEWGPETRRGGSK
jgi:NADH-quinone oxidoreductase subunit A